MALAFSGPCVKGVRRRGGEIDAVPCCEFAQGHGEFAEAAATILSSASLTAACLSARSSPLGLSSLPRLRFDYPLHRDGFGLLRGFDQQQFNDRLYAANRNTVFCRAGGAAVLASPFGRGAPKGGGEGRLSHGQGRASSPRGGAKAFLGIRQIPISYLLF